MVTAELLCNIIPVLLDLTHRRPGGRDFWYICQICMRAYPIYWVPTPIWRKSGFKKKSVCKHCFESVIPHPKYCTIDEYMQEAMWANADNPVIFERIKNGLIAVWGQPEEEPPEPRTWNEIKGLLSKGECTIQYATSSAQVMKMCKLCSRLKCVGPYAYGDR